MRIHSGKYKNKKIKRVGIESTRETSSLVRESVFNMIGIVNGNVLDLFAGSGSYGLTALSLGASDVYFVDNNRKSYLTINENIKNLGVNDKAKVYLSNYDYFLKKCNNRYDYIFLDPPYNFNDYNQLLEDVITSVSYDNTTIILEVDKNTMVLNTINNFYANKVKIYGNKKIIIYKHDN